MPDKKVISEPDTKIAKIINFVKTYQSDIILSITVVLISVISFNLGKISAFKNSKVPISINNANTTQQANINNAY